MRNKTFIRSVAALSVAAMLGISGSAFAKSRNAKSEASYDRAWASCKNFVDEEGLTWDQTQQRYARMGACMTHYGYRL